MANYDVTTANSLLIFATQNASGTYYNSCFKVDTNHFINFYGDVSTQANVNIFAVDTSTFAVTTANSALNYNTTVNSNSDPWNSCQKVDTNHFINFYKGTSNRGTAQVIAVNTSTWACTTASAKLEFDTNASQGFASVPVDVNHFLVFWFRSSTGEAQVISVNTTTFAVATAGALKTTSADGSSYATCAVDTNHFILLWSLAAGTHSAQVFAVNTSTWAVTTAASAFSFEAGNSGGGNIVFKMDATHFMTFYTGGGGFASNGFAQVFVVNTTTWAVTTAAARLNFAGMEDMPTGFQIDTNHFILFWPENPATSEDGYVQVFTVNTSTWVVTTSAASLDFDTASPKMQSCYQIDSAHYINFWRGAAAGTDRVQVFTVQLPVVSNIKTYNTNAQANIKAVDTNLNANMKTLDTNVNAG